MQYKGEGLRTVLVNLPHETVTIRELRPLLTLLSRHPRVRFAVVLIYPNANRERFETGEKAWLPIGISFSACMWMFAYFA